MSLPARALATAANRPCPRLDLAAHHGWADTAVAKAYGYTNKSPRLAYALGKAFEDRFTADTDRLMRLADADHGAVAEVNADHGDSEAYQQFQELLADEQTTMILQGVAPGLFGGWLRPDLVFSRDGQWHVGEVKIYLDKGGETDAHAFGQAVTQAAASVLTLRRSGVNVSDDVLVILTNLIGQPTGRWVNAAGELHRLQMLEQRAQYQGGASTSAPDLFGTEHIYSIRCEGACALAEYCREQLRETEHAVFPSLGLAHAMHTTDQELMTMAHHPGTAVHAGYTAAVSVGVTS